VLRAASMAIVVLVASAVITSPASGKEPTRVVLCGLSDCSAVVDRAVRRRLVDYGPPTAPPPRSQRLRWFTVRVTVSWASRPGVRGHETYTERYYPDARMLHGPGRTWSLLSDDESVLYTGLTRSIEPLGAVQSNPASAAPGSTPVAQADSTTSGDASRRLAIAGSICLVALTATAVFIHRRRSSRLVT